MKRRKLIAKIGIFALCVCTVLMLLPTTAFAATTATYGDIIVSYSRTESLDVQAGSTNNDYLWRWYDWSLTDANGLTDATYSGTMVMSVNGSYSVSGGSYNMMVYPSTSYSYATSSNSNNTITWTFTNATLSQLEDLIDHTWIFTSQTNANGATGVGLTEMVSFSGSPKAGTTYTATVDTAADADDGSGTVQADGTTISGSASVSEGNVTFTFVPASDSYVSGYKIIGADGTVLANAEELTGSGNKTVTVNVTQNVTVQPAFTTVGTDKKAEGTKTDRDAGSLLWASEATTLSYKDALGFNYNAKVDNYLLDSRYGKSWTYGVDPLENPEMYMYAVFDSEGAAVVIQDGTADSPKDLGQGTSTTAEAGKNLVSSITASNVKPGKFTQTVEANYYNASSVCSNHWYHVGGVAYHMDGLNREITILKDTMTLSGVESSYDYADGLYDTIISAATLTPASSGVSGSQASLDSSKVSIKILDSEGNVVTSIDKAGEYTLVATYEGDDYIATYAEGADTTAENTYSELTAAFTVNLGANPAEVTEPSVTNTTATSITLSNIDDEQEYSIDGGTTWITGAELKKQNSTFSDLTPGTEYTIQTRIPENEKYQAKTTSQEATTYVTVEGSVEASGTAVPALPATVVFTDTSDPSKTYSVVTDENGNYSIDLPLGTYSMEVEGKDGLQSGSASSSVQVSGNETITAETVTMTNTSKGDAKVFADSYLTDDNGDVITSLDGVDSTNIDKIIGSEEDYNALSDEAKAEVDKLTAPTTYKKLLETAKIIKQAEEEKAAIEAMVPDRLSEEDAKALTDAVDAAVDKAKDSLNNAETDDEITAAVDQFAEDMDLIKEKTAAAEEINSDAQAAKDAVDSLGNLTDEEKQAIKDEIDAAAKTAKDAVNEATDEDGINAAKEQFANDIKDITDKAAADDFIAGYFTDEDGNVYSEIDSDNIDKILEAREAYEELTEDQKALVDEMISEATGGKYTSYDELEKAAQDAVEESANSFIENHMTTSDGEIITEATADTYDSILGGKEDWEKLSQAEKDAINAKLKEAGATQTYEEMLAAVEAAVEESSESFISKYLTDENGSVYTEATSENYAQILSGLSDWNNLTQSEKDAINAKLVANGGMTYEQLIEKAQQIKAEIDAANANIPKTSGENEIALWFILMMLSGICAGIMLCDRKRRYGK